MTRTTRSIILEKATELYAAYGYSDFSIRKLAKRIPIAHSVIYHYFKDEETLLREMFDYTNTMLGERRRLLPKSASAHEMLKSRIGFQIDNAQSIVAVLKYYLSHRPSFPKNKQGFVPDKSALHIEEVLRYGIQTGEFHVFDLQNDAKVMTHAINGFLLEYYPHSPKGKEKEALVERIHTFLVRALKGGEQNV